MVPGTNASDQIAETDQTMLVIRPYTIVRQASTIRQGLLVKEWHNNPTPKRTQFCIAGERTNIH